MCGCVRECAKRGRATASPLKRKAEMLKTEKSCAQGIRKGAKRVCEGMRVWVCG